MDFRTDSQRRAIFAKMYSQFSLPNPPPTARLLNRYEQAKEHIATFPIEFIESMRQMTDAERAEAIELVHLSIDQHKLDEVEGKWMIDALNNYNMLDNAEMFVLLTNIRPLMGGFE
jgi:hypothetical protein